MKHLKILGLAAVAAMALMAFASSASATTLCKEGVESGCATANRMHNEETLAASISSSAALKTSGGTTIATCTGGNVSGPITKEGPSGAVEGEIKELTWSGCNTTVDTLKPGTLSLSYTSGHNGTVVSNGAEVTLNFLGVSCVFHTTNTTIGTLTGGSPATFDINGTIPSSTGGLCPSSGIWSGSYVVTNPSTTLDVASS